MTTAQAVTYATGKRSHYAIVIEFGNHRHITVAPTELAMDETEALRNWRRHCTSPTLRHWERLAERIYAKRVG